MTSDVLLPIAIPILIVLVWLFNCLNIMREYERAVVFRLGRVLKKEKGPGLVLILWPIDKIVKVSLRVVTWDVPPQDVITRDNVSLKVNAVVYFRVISATKAIIEVENFRYAVEQAAQTGLRSVLGEVELDDLLAQREKLNVRLQTILDEHTGPGASRSCRSKSSRWICRKRCSGRLRPRPRQSASGEPRLSRQKANSKRPPNWPKRPPS